MLPYNLSVTGVTRAKADRVARLRCFRLPGFVFCSSSDVLVSPGREETTGGDGAAGTHATGAAG